LKVEKKSIVLWFLGAVLLIQRTREHLLFFKNPALIHLRFIAIRETLFSLIWQHQTTIPDIMMLLKKNNPEGNGRPDHG